MVIKDEVDVEIGPGDTVAWKSFGGKMRKGIVTKIILWNTTYNSMSVVVKPINRLYQSERMGKRRIQHFVKVAS